jgi:hypothetical protein
MVASPLNMLHVPPADVSVNVAVPPTQIVAVIGVIAAGPITVRFLVFVQPPSE